MQIPSISFQNDGGGGERGGEGETFRLIDPKLDTWHDISPYFVLDD